MQNFPAIAVSPTNRYLPALMVIFTLSLLLHALIFFLFFTAVFSGERPLPYVFNVVLDNLPQSPPAPQEMPSIPRQIVSEPERSDKPVQPPENSRFLAERNATVQKEQLKRGDSFESSPAQGKRSALSKAATEITSGEKKGEPRQRSEQPSPKSSDTKRELSLADLKLSSETLLKRFSSEDANKQPQSLTATAKLDQPLGSYEAFSRPSGSGARFLGMPGTADYIPDLPDGDITMLNTKASHFAVFVRRVAVQVFSQLRAVGWDRMNASDIRSISDFCTVRATLSREGELMAVRIEAPSGSQRFDQVVRLAVERGAKDPNPPPEALSAGGTFEFIFKARSWVRLRSNPRTGAPSEARWLLLGTGLE